MGQDSKIEWTHHTFNPWRGCTKVSDGCKHCYAETMSKRNPSVLGVWGPRGRRVVAAESYWRQPLAWNCDAEQAGERRRVFCASLADVFEGPETMPAESWPVVEAARARLWRLIEVTPWLDWLLLTKRPVNAAQNSYVPITWWERWPDNVWIGTSVENQAAADERIRRGRFCIQKMNRSDPLWIEIHARLVYVDKKARRRVAKRQGNRQVPGKETTMTTPSINLNAFRAPASTYFRASDVSPELVDNEIRCSNGTSYSASWGSSYSNSTIVHKSEALIVIRVKWGNKHAWGTQDYYFIPDRKGNWKKQTTKTGARAQLAAAGI